jgi:hypothetical protein
VPYTNAVQVHGYCGRAECLLDTNYNENGGTERVHSNRNWLVDSNADGFVGRPIGRSTVVQAASVVPGVQLAGLVESQIVLGTSNSDSHPAISVIEKSQYSPCDPYARIWRRSRSCHF